MAIYGFYSQILWRTLALVIINRGISIDQLTRNRYGPVIRRLAWSLDDCPLFTIM